jgi:ribosomal protein S18 acetylase RimI-like enzyme
VTLNLLRRSINQWTLPWDSHVIGGDIENGNVYIMTSNEYIIGTFSLRNMSSNLSINISESNNLYLYRIAILPECQGKDAGCELIDYAVQISRNLGKSLYLDCWAGNEKLKTFYSKAGFNYCGDFPEEDYQISLFKYF